MANSMVLKPGLSKNKFTLTQMATEHQQITLH